MSLKNDILLCLEKERDYISGEMLANKFGKSRAAVWKSIKALQNEGYKIDAITNKGYLLTNENDIITVDAIKSHLKEDIDVLYFSSIDSTNNEAKRMLASGFDKCALLVGEEQTAGRGRQGKSFYSPALTGIYMTLITHPMQKLQNAVTATTAASVAVCKAIENITDKKPQIKWVNDVYLDGKKICGILTEAITDFETQIVSSVVIGIGMNINTVKFPNDVENASSLNANVNRSRLIAEITNELHNIVGSEYSTFIDYYRSHSMIIGKNINFIRDSKVTPAKVVSIDEEGGLEVMLQNGETEVLRSGEISIRKR